MRSAIDQLENLGESLTKYASAHVVTVAYVLLCAVILFVRFLNDKMKSLETASEQHRRSQRDEGVGTGGEGGIRLITQANEDERDADGVETAVPLPLQPSGDSHTQGIVVETPMLLLPLGDLDEESPPVVEQVEHDGATICSRGNVRKMLKYSIVFLWLYIAGTTLMQMTLASLNAVALVGMWLVTSSLVWRVARLSVNRDDAINFLIEKLSGMCCIGSLMVIWLLVSFMSCMIQEEGTHRNVTRHSRWKNPPSEDVVFKALCDEGDESCLHGLHKREEIICLVALAYVLLGAVILFVRIMNEKMKRLEQQQDKISQQDEIAGAGDEGGIRLITQANDDEGDDDGVETAVPLQPSGDSDTPGIVAETPMLLIPLRDLGDESPPVVEQVDFDGTSANHHNDALDFLMEKFSGMCCTGSLMVIGLLVSFVSCIIFFGALEEGNARENGHSQDVVFKALCDEGDESCLRGLHKREEIICLVALAYVLLGAVIVFVRIMNEKMKSLETASEQDKISQRDERVDTDGEGGSDEDDKPRQRKRDHWATTTTATYQLQGDDRDIESKDEFTPKIALVVETAVPLPLRPSIRGERRT